MPTAMQSPFSQFAGVGTGELFPNPFLDVASLAMPGSLKNALYWCEYIFSKRSYKRKWSANALGRC